MYGSKIKKIRSLALLVLTLAVVSVVQAHVLAIARGYTTDDTGLQAGMVVALSLDPSSQAKVERATQASSDRVVGIVTTIDTSLVTVGSGVAKVLVESEGQTEAYVSDINGPVSQGDNLVLSPLKGVLMKLSANVPTTVIALAATGSITETVYSYQDNGQPKETNISKISINLNRQGVDIGIVESDSALAKLGRSIVGKDVGEIRVLIALIIFIIVLIAEGGIIYGAVSSAITALGRNPLARKAIRSELLRVAAIAVAVLLLGVAAVYAVLWV